MFMQILPAHAKGSCVHIIVGSMLARSILQGNARASICGTSKEYSSHIFLCRNGKNNDFLKAEFGDEEAQICKNMIHRKLMLSVFLCLPFLCHAQMSGSGTAEDPYQVKTAFDLFDVRSELSAHYILMNDIDLSDWIAEESPTQGWAPIGTKTSPFTGVVDGNNKTIKGLYINRPSTDYVGLFGYIQGANIHHICLVNPVITANNNCGTIVGGTTSNVEFSLADNVCIGGNITANDYVGGIIGSVCYGDYPPYVRVVTNVVGNYSSSNISANSIVGGIVGDLQGQYYTSWGNYMISSVRDNHYAGKIMGNSICGGIVGQASAYYYTLPLDVNIVRNLAGGTIEGNSNINGILGGRAGENTTQNDYFLIKNNLCYMDVISSKQTAYRIYSEPFPDNFAQTTTKIIKDGVIIDVEDNNYNGTSLGVNTLRRKNTYLGMEFDFDTQWDINGGETYPYNIEQCTPVSITSCTSGEHAKVSGTAPSDGKVYVFVNNVMYEGDVVGGEWEINMGSIEEGVMVRVSADSDNKMASILVNTVTENAVTTLDENSTTVPLASDGNVDIKVLRTLKKDNWSTIVLPFNMTEEQLKAAFGDDVELAEFTDYEVDDEDNVTSINVHFAAIDLTEGLLANYPYMIKVSRNISEFTTRAEIAPDEENAISEYAEGRGAKRHVYGTFIGTYHAQTVVPNRSLFVSGNQFWYSKGETKMKAYRAYFTFEDVLATIDNANSRIFILLDNDNSTTEVKGIKELTKKSESVVFNLAGQRIDKPTKGFYIINNKKIFIK